MADVPSNVGGIAEEGKGKGKGVDTAADVSMGEEEDSSEDDEGEAEVEEPEEEDEDNMEEIDTDNIVGRRTRGKTIDFATAAQNTEGLADEEDEEDDEDFEEPSGDDAMEQ